MVAQLPASERLFFGGADGSKPKNVTGYWDYYWGKNSNHGSWVFFPKPAQLTTSDRSSKCFEEALEKHGNKNLHANQTGYLKPSI